MDQTGATPMLLASLYGHLELVRLLCDAGADKDKADQNGGTHMEGGSINGPLGVVQLLCDAGAEKDKAALLPCQSPSSGGSWTSESLWSLLLCFPVRVARAYTICFSCCTK